MESPKKAETRRPVHTSHRKDSQNDSEDELLPPSPIDIATEPALSPDFNFPDAQELRRIESDTHNRLKAILEVAGVTGLSQIDARTFQDPEILRKLTNSVSTALDEAATALTRMKSEKQSYEAFLRGANQAPSPSQQEPTSNAQTGYKTNSAPSTKQPKPPQSSVDPRAETPPLSMQAVPTRQSSKLVPQNQPKPGSQIFADPRAETPPLSPGLAKTTGSARQTSKPQPHPVAVESGDDTPPLVSPSHQTQSLQQQASDSMQSLQRLLTQGHTIQDATEDGESLLSLACSAGYYELAEVLLRMRASVEDRGVKGDSTPLMEAASGGYSDIVKLLIDHGANVNAKSSVGNTALTYACCGGYEEVVRILLEAGADVEHQNENGHTPLMEAASCGHVGVAKQLLDHGANINTHSNEFKESALTLACYKGHLEMVKFLLSAGADQEHKTDEMHTALMEASMDGHVDVARLLLDHGAQVNMPVDSFESPLTLAACGGHYELAALLISRGADLEEVNDEGYTPLMEAAREGHEDVVQLLVEHGANVNAQTEETQETALTLAACGGFIEVAQYLIEHGADIELGASTPLMEASQEGHVNIVKFLVDKGALINAETNTGDTALTYACANGHTHIADILLQCGAELEHESEGGRTPLMKAARAGHLQTVQFLVSKGAEVNRHTSNNDHTVLSLASAGGHISVVQYLLIKGALPSHMLRDNSTMLIEASRGGHANVANLLLRQPRHMPRKLPSPEPAPQVTSTSREYGPGERKGLIRKAEVNRPATKDQVVPKSGIKSLARDSGNAGLGVKRLKMAEPESSVRQQATSLPNTGVSKSVSKPSTPPVPVPERGSSVDLPISQPPLIQGLPTQLLSHLPPPSQMTHPPGCHMTGSDVINEHPTADTIIEEYWKQEPGSQKPPTSTMPVGFDNADSVFSAGNFSSLPIPSGTGPGRGDPIAPSSVDEQHSLANVNLSRIIPTLEALAGSLQDPNSLESRYLAALATHTQLGATSDPALGETPPLLSNGLDALPHMMEGGPIPMAGLDTPALLSSADIASLLPSLANFDPSATDFLSRQLDEGSLTDTQQPIYPSSYFQTMKQLSDRMHLIAASVGRGDVEEPLGVKSGQQPSSSLLLDSNFSMDDIPPPDNFIPAEHLSGYDGSGYEESLDNETCAYPTSDEEAGNDEDDDGLDGDESDTSYIVPDLSVLPPGTFDPAIDIEQETESNHDTALTLAAAGGHDELVELLLAHGANIEHRDKKGCTSLILAASAGHALTVAILLDHSANIEAQSDRTKDTALSLACTGGRQEVVELLLAKGANFEHRNVSDYTPLSLAASGGYVNIIKLLLRAGADINSRTGSKLGISPLMLAAMNGHTSTVKLLLDMGSDINAQIETNRNTALTLACFQGRHEVVTLLVERQANVEHRAKTGLTPLMEAASGGYHEVGKVLISKGADVNASPVPSSKDTALTISADKGHFKFVELILRHGSFVDVKNKKGNSPLWLTCNGGHLDVVRLLVQYGADVDSQDNRKITSLMIAFKRGHLKVVKYLVEHVTQFPSDSELTRFISNITDKDLLKKCQRCMEVIIDAKERQAAEANKNATSLLMEIDQEKKHEEDRKAAAARKRAKKKRQKEKKQAAIKAQKDTSDDKCDDGGSGDSPQENEPGEPDDFVEEDLPEPVVPSQNSRLPLQDTQITPPSKPDTTDTSYRQNKRNTSVSSDPGNNKKSGGQNKTIETNKPLRIQDISKETENRVILSKSPSLKNMERPVSILPPKRELSDQSLGARSTNRKTRTTALKPQGMTTPTSSPRKGRREEGWKEVGRRTKKISIPLSVFGQIVGKSSANLNAIKQGTNTAIEIDKVSKQSTNRSLTIRGSTDAVKLAHQCITSLTKDPSQELPQLIRRITGTPPITTAAQKRYVPPSSDPNPTLYPYDELPGAPPATGNATAHAYTSVSSPITVTASISNPARSLQKKSSSSQIVPSGVTPVAGSNKSKANTTVIMASHEKAVIDTKPTFVTNVVPTSRASVIGTTMSAQGLPSGPAPVLARSSSAGSTVQPATSGAVRKLFVTSTQPVKPPPASRAPFSNSSKTILSRSNSKPIITQDTSTVVKSSSTESNCKPTNNTYPQQVPVSTASKTMSYSRIIAPQESIRGQPNEVIEQPVQQIMKSPTFFQEAATQISKPKKISTYSDAVGKKYQSAMASGVSCNNFGNENARMMGSTGSVYPPSSSVGGVSPAQTQSTKMNLAPGTRPVGDNDKPVTSLADKRNGSNTRSVPWGDLVDKTSPDYHQQGFEDENKDKLSPPSSGLGPIGPPSKSCKPLSTTPVSAVKSGPRSYSPSSSRPSPAGVSASPQRAELSPAAKSPLLGPAPPGLLPPPDKGYGSSFRPIHGVEYSSQADTPGSSSNNSFQTLVPTPVRNQRPPLLATPPGLSMLQQGVRPGSITPLASPDKISPNKSPPHPSMNKGFNPNAPSFVPMALQPGPRPSVVTTSSILGAPPTVKYHSFGPPTAVAGGNSILGAPQMPPMYGNANTQPRMVSPVPSIFPNQPPPPNVIQAPGPPQGTQQQPQPAGGQTSILGQPPPIFGGTMLPQGFSPALQNQPPSGIFGGPQIENNQAPPQSLQHPPPPFGINLIPFQVNGQQQPSQNFVGVQPTQVLVSTPLADGFQVQSDAQQVGHAVIVSANNMDFSAKMVGSAMYPNKSGEAVIDLRQMSANTGLSIGVPGPVLFSATTHSPNLPITSPGVSGVRTNDSLFNLSMDSFSGLYPNTQTVSVVKDPKAAVDALYAKGSKMAMSGEGVMADGLLPIGTERAQKSSAMPSFTVLTPGILPSNVWSYSGSTEDSDWSKVGPVETSWPSLPDSTLSPHDTLESVLGRLGLLDYYHLLQRNEIDLNALMLMSEQDFAEIGLPPGPRQTLLLGIGRVPTLNSLDRPVSKGNSDGGGVGSPPITHDQGPPSNTLGPASASQ